MSPAQSCVRSPKRGETRKRTKRLPTKPPSPHHQYIDRDIECEERCTQCVLRCTGQSVRVEHGQQIPRNEVAPVSSVAGTDAKLVLEGRQWANPPEQFDTHASECSWQVRPHELGPFQCQQPAKDHEENEREVSDEHGIGKDRVHDFMLSWGRSRMPLLRTATLNRTSLAIVLLAVSCGPALQPHAVTLPQPNVRPAERATEIDDYRVAIVTVARLIEQEVGVPQFPVTFHFFPDEAAFEAKLLEVGYEPALARNAAREMVAIGGHRGVLLNESKLLGRSWIDRVALFAHELTHSLQYELGGGRRGASDQWMREGFADWISMRVLERLGAARPGDLRRHRIEEFRRRGSTTVPFEEMATFRQWVDVSARSEGATYLQAFLATDFLIERHGMSALISYFSGFARSDDRLGIFRRTFGQELRAFEKALLARVRRLPPV